MRWERRAGGFGEIDALCGNDGWVLGRICYDGRGSTHVTLRDFHILDVPTFDHEISGI